MQVGPWDRRVRPERASTQLLEREAALQVIEVILDCTDMGPGQALLIEGHPGIGKTRLHEAALESARKRGLRALRAAGAEFERNIAFGLVGQLLGAHLNNLPQSKRGAVRAAIPAPVGALVGARRGTTEHIAHSDPDIFDSVFNVLFEGGMARPSLLAIDDLHWCDLGSLEFLLYVLERLDELATALVMTRRTGAGPATLEVLDRIASHRRVRIEALSPLGRGSVAQLARQSLGERADATVVDACEEATWGNPFYLHELLLELRQGGELTNAELALRARSLVPDVVARSLRVRVGRVGQSAAALARAVAILGDDAPLGQAAALAGLEKNAASTAAAALADVEILLARHPLRFVHPLVRHAIEQDVPKAELATRHYEAARLLHRERESPERVAAHLLLSHARADPWAIEQLQAAARIAWGRGAPDSALRYLKRALQEPPRGELRGEVLAHLAELEATVGLDEAPGHFAQAIESSNDPDRRARWTLQRGRCLDVQGRREQAVEAYEAGLRELAAEATERDQAVLRAELEMEFVASAAELPSLQSQALGRLRQLAERATARPQSQGQPLRLASLAMHAAFADEPAEKISALAERAWDGGRLLESETAQGAGWRLVSTAYVLAGALERALEVAGAADQDARRRSWPFAIATAGYIRGLPSLWQARVDVAIGHLELAREARRLGWRRFDRAAAAHLALALIEKGELDRAEQVLLEESPPEPIHDVQDAMRLHALAEVRMAQGRAHEALALALRAGAAAEGIMGLFAHCPWRVTAAEAALALGDHRRAVALAREAAALSERTPAVHRRLGALRVLALCQDVPDRIEALRAAVNLARKAPPRLETIRTLVELGATLRRANQRSAARLPLDRAADMARTGGASALHERASTELAAAGARSRRELPLGGAASLTPSERRIAELAATGYSNREIAQTLFVTPKTVEYHLRNTYRKLAIEKRAELSDVFGEPETSPR